jgi:hypothetical protein
MIQRVQTLFLLATAISLIVLLFVPIWGADVLGGTTKAELDAYNLSYSVAGAEAKSESTIYIAALAILGTLTAFFTIFKFKNRKLQLTMGWLNMLIISGIIGTFFIGISKAHDIIGPEKGTYNIGFFLPLVAIITTYMANFYIKKDEKLVRSMDRLR